MTVTQEEFELRLEKCGELPPTADEVYQINDYMENLFLTVLDFMMHRRTVEKAIDYYKPEAARLEPIRS